MTAPGLGWGACLKMTEVELEPMTNPEMWLFIDRSLIGGVGAILQPYTIANNPKRKDYDKEKPTSFMKYFDTNNLYRWSMCQYLPTGGFIWMELSIELSKVEEWEKFIL